MRDTDLGAYQRAARTVLVHPLVTATVPDSDALALVRRFAAPLAADLDTLAGYRLEMAPSCVRLVRRFDRLDPTQVVITRNRKPFDRRRYAYLCLVLAALNRAASQVALTELADGLKRRAAEVEGLSFDSDEYRHRLAFADVVAHLEGLGAVRPVEVSAVAWLRDPDAGEALYDVERDVVHLAFVAPRVLQHVGSTRALLATALATSRDTRREEVRQRLTRLLLEHPVVYFDDLDGADRAYLLAQARVVGDDLARLTGAQLERRAEGVALIDATGGFSDRRFPASGTPSQAALLLADAIAARLSDGDTADHGAEVSVPTTAEELDEAVERIDRARPSAPVELGTPDPADPLAGPANPDRATPDLAPPVGRTPAPLGPFLTDAWLDEQATWLCATYGKAFSADLRADPAAVLAAAVEVLAAFDLVRRVPGGLVARPAIGRYRNLTVAVAASPQLSLQDLDTTAEAS
ncbi:MAG: TIGR02678 family protein [Acidimicrobiales bacterium]